MTVKSLKDEDKLPIKQIISAINKTMDDVYFVWLMQWTWAGRKLKLTGHIELLKMEEL